METRERVRTFLAENFLLSSGFDLGDDASLLESGVVDSTGVLELIAFVEEAFQIEVRDEEVVPEHFDSVERIATYVESKAGCGAAAR
jgi:acyl carrier protein